MQCDENSSATGSNSSVIGMSSSATADGSFAGGYGSEANGALSFAFGNQVIAGATNSVAFGRFVETSASPSFIFGVGTGPLQSEKLINNNPYSLMVGFNSNKPTFFVGMSDGADLTGKIGIGNVTDPKAKLHIKADNGENADLMLEPGGSSKYAIIKFGETLPNVSPNRITAKPSGDLGFYSGSDFVFNSGAVGIGVINPTEKLEVDGTVKSTGLMLNDGTQAAGKVLQSDATGLASWVDPMDLTVDDGDWTVTQAGNLVNANSGKVGIGVNSPLFNLHVKKSGTLGLQNEDEVLDGEIASISVGDINGTEQAKLVFERGEGQIAGGNGSPSSIISFYTTPAQGILQKAIAINEDQRLICYGGASFEGNVSFNNDVYLNGNWIKRVWSPSGGIYLDNSNHVGIGTDTPGALLDVNGDINANSIDVTGSISVYNTIKGNVLGQNWWLRLKGSDVQYAPEILLGTGDQVDLRKIQLITQTNTGDIEFWTNNTLRLKMKGQDEMVIGSSSSNYNMKINGKIDAYEVEVHVESWSDDVFEKGYNLRRLNEVSDFINANGHLPEIPSETEVLENGYNMGEMDAMLLKKIEELTLYIIDLQKKIDKKHNP